MPLLYFSKEEVLALSSHSRITPNSISPMSWLYVEKARDNNIDKLREAVEEFCKNNYIKKDAEGNLLLSKELEPLMFILHTPEEVYAIKRLGDVSARETYFCVKKGFVAQHISSSDKLFETIMYPLSVEYISKWFSTELFSDIKFEGSEFQKMKITATADEAVVLFTIQSIYKERVMTKDALGDEDMLISLEDLIGFSGNIELNGLMNVLADKKDIKTYLKDNPNLPTVINHLKNKGFIDGEGNKVKYSKVSKTIFNPGLMKDCIIVKKASEKEAKITSVNILSGGYVVLKPEGVDFTIETFPGSMDKEVLFKALL